MVIAAVKDIKLYETPTQQWSEQISAGHIQKKSRCRLRVWEEKRFGGLGKLTNYIIDQM